uniref:uncharacterized protein LOC120347631 n=1 Tax=Styela clava TaxID=7725 RepID=UPI0019397403|nr:uncharacterized protein LOC120347631 [Styela clava]
MALRSVLYPRPFKFVIVGAPGSGKTTLIRKFVAGFSEENDPNDGEEEELSKNAQTNFLCNLNHLTLKTTVKHVCKNGSSVAMTKNDITRRLWVKKHSRHFVRRNIVLTENDKRDIIWDEIFVYIQRPFRGVDGRRGCRSFSASTKTEDLKKADIEDLKAESDGGTAKAAPRKSSRKRRSKRSTIANDKLDSSKRTSLLGRALHERLTNSDIAEMDVEIWDTGEGESHWHQWYNCSGADAVLLCVPMASILGSESYENSEANKSDVKIADDLKEFVPEEFLNSRKINEKGLVPPVILVGTKSDLCGSRISHCSVFDDTDIEDSIGLDLAKEIGCCDFVRCSGSRGWGMSALFETAFAVSLTSDGSYRASTRKEVIESIPSDVDSVMAQEVAQPTYFRVHSFQKDSKPPIISITKHDNTNTKDVVRLSHHGSAVQRSSTPKKQPPQIFFPPPPEYSPPSTCPPSSTSSRLCSDKSSSLESLTDIQLHGISHITQSPSKNMTGSTISESEKGLTPPIPAPRRKRNKENRNLDKKPSIKKDQHDEASLSTDVELPPTSKSRSRSQSSLSSTKLSRRERRESVFLKFIQI